VAPATHVLSTCLLGFNASHPYHFMRRGNTCARKLEIPDSYNSSMLLTLTTTHRPATDLGYLLHKNPATLHSFELSFGKAHVFYPEATSERCTAALLLDVDPVGLVRGKRGQHEGGTLDQYVNDRPYVLSSFLSVAMGRAFGTAMSGRSKGRQELADQAIPLIANLAVVACRGGASLIRELFEPLGYGVTAEHHPLDAKFPEWGEGPYYSVALAGTFRLQDLLNHLYVLIPVLDAEKHYWIGNDEVEKLLRKGEGWLASHPTRKQSLNDTCRVSANWRERRSPDSRRKTIPILTRQRKLTLRKKRKWRNRFGCGSSEWEQWLRCFDPSRRSASWT
jgi:hypothetical protein